MLRKSRQNPLLQTTSKEKQKNKCRFLRGAGFGNLVERFFENPCRFFALHVAARR